VIKVYVKVIAVIEGEQRVYLFASNADIGSVHFFKKPVVIVIMDTVAIQIDVIQIGVHLQ
jgi:hypothetical protein